MIRFWRIDWWEGVQCTEVTYCTQCYYKHIHICDNNSNIFAVMLCAIYVNYQRTQLLFILSLSTENID